jgi:antitoxin component of MazEF toxin-antitoxin module
MVALPSALLGMVSLAAGQEVAVSVNAGRLVIEPCKRPRHTLARLMAVSAPRGRHRTRDRSWLDSPAKGRELL